MNTTNFGHLRSLMNQTTLSDEDKRALQGMIKQQHVEDHDVYETQWLPYMASFEHHWREPFMVCQTVPMLVTWSNYLPFAWFHVSFFSTTFARELLHTPALERVRALTLYDCRLRGHDLEEISQTALCQNVHFLDLGDNHHLGQSPESIEAFGNSAHFKQLRHLDMRHTFTNSVLLDYLLDGQAMEALEHLILQDSITTQGALFLAQLPKLSTLKTLSLRHCKIQNEGIEAILNAQHLTSLEQLDISSNPIDDTVLDMLENRKGCPGLKTLKMSVGQLEPQNQRRLQRWHQQVAEM